MGCYLGLRDVKDGYEHPAFEVDKIGTTGWDDPDDWVSRPTDFACWRKAVAMFENPRRELAMLDAMEANPNLWIEVSW